MYIKTASDYDIELKLLKQEVLILEARIKFRAIDLIKRNPGIVLNNIKMRDNVSRLSKLTTDNIQKKSLVEQMSIDGMLQCINQIENILSKKSEVTQQSLPLES